MPEDGKAAAFACDQSRGSREHADASRPDPCEQPLFPRFQAALRAPGGPLGPARAGRGPSPSAGAAAPSAAPRPGSALPHRALSYLCIIVAGTLAGLLLGSQLSPVAIAPEAPANDAGLGQAFAVTARSPVGIGPSSAREPRPGPPAAPVYPLPRASATAVIASTAGLKGGMLRWQPEAALRPNGAPAGTHHARTARQIQEIERALGRAFYQLAYSRQRHGDAEAAMAGYERAGALDPEHAATWYNWALLLERTDAPERAVDKYVRAIRADRSHRFAWYNLGYLLQRRGDVDGAIRVYERAIAVGATHPLTFYNLGWLEQSGGRHELAAQLYREALALDPAHVLARYNLGYLLELRGDAKGAAEQYRAVLEIEPRHALARASLDRLDARGDPRVAAKEE